MTKTENPICRSFRQDFPQFVQRAEALGVRIQLGGRRPKGKQRVFWLDGYRQMTGYDTKADGSAFTDEDAAKNIDKILTEIEKDRAQTADLSLADRFARVMAEFRQMEPQYRMIGEVRQPNGDRGHCFFMSDYDGGVTIEGVGEVARVRVQSKPGETALAQMERFCRALEVDFEGRHPKARA